MTNNKKTSIDLHKFKVAMVIWLLKNDGNDNKNGCQFKKQITLLQIMLFDSKLKMLLDLKELLDKNVKLK